MRRPKLGIIGAALVEISACLPLLIVREAISEAGAEELVANLRSEDQKVLGQAFRATYTLEIPVNELDADQGKVVKTTLVSQRENGLVMKVTYDCPSPVYKPRGTKGYDPRSYDEQGNLLFWRKTREFIYCTSIENKLCVEMEKLLVAKDGSILDRAFAWRLDRYPPDRRDPLNEFDVFCLATGRGYGSCCQVIDEHQTLPNGKVRLRGTGRYMETSMKGTWEVVLDGDTKLSLVTEASLISSPAGEPIITISCVNPVLLGDTRLMERAVIWYRPFDKNLPYEVALVIQEYAEAPNSDLFDEVKTQLAQPLPRGRSVIFDHRAGGDPVISHPGR